LKRFVLAVLMMPLAFPAQSPYDSLRLFEGTWQVHKKGAADADRLENQCALLGIYFGCQQTLNGKMAALVLYIPRETPGTYYTQAVLPDGTAVGRGELEIKGDHWTFLSHNADTTYRTTNVFAGKDRIRFEHSESKEGNEWKVTGSGEEIRVAPTTEKKPGV
jgi:hypothetical protein